MYIKTVKVVSIVLLAVLAVAPILAAFRMPDPFSYSTMIAAPAIVGEAFVNYIFNFPALMLAIILIIIGFSLLKSDKKTVGAVFMSLSIVVSVFGLSLMIFRSTIYG